MIILDLDMPIMNGFDACKRIRQDPKVGLKELVRISSRYHIEDSSELIEEQKENFFQKEVVIIALSGLITDSVIEHGKACGFNDFSKLFLALIQSFIVESPITVEKINTVIIEQINKQQKLLLSNNNPNLFLGHENQNFEDQSQKYRNDDEESSNHSNANLFANAV